LGEERATLFLYFISGAKERNPAAAKAMLASAEGVIAATRCA
jgi:hypothetical protein